jgi:hypothetical protein
MTCNYKIAEGYVWGTFSHCGQIEKESNREMGDVQKPGEQNQLQLQ